MAQRIVLLIGLSLLLSSCGTPQEVRTEVTSGSSRSFHVYVTNERSGDLSVIDGRTLQVMATVPLGKRPRGIHASPDGKTIYVALSGSPIAPPGVDESTLPPPDK